MDTVENINCMISGSKKWFLVDLVSLLHFFVSMEEFSTFLLNAFMFGYEGFVLLSVVQVLFKWQQEG